MGSGAPAVRLVDSAAGPPAVLRVPPRQRLGSRASGSPRTHCPSNGKEKRGKKGGRQEQPCSELRAPHKGRRQVGLLCQLPGGKRERGGGFPDSGRREGRIDSSSATDHFQQRAPRRPSTGRLIQPRTCPPIAPQGKINFLLSSLSP